MEILSIDEIAKACMGKIYNCSPDLKVYGISTDSRKIKEGDLFIPIKGDRFDGHDFVLNAIQSGAAAVIVHSDIEYDIPYIKVSDTLCALLDLSKYYKNKFNIPFIAITGSSGKTTTKEMIASVLLQKYRVLKTEGNYNNAIGLPLTLMNLEFLHEIAILEMGMNSIGEINILSDLVKQETAVITNIGTAHIEKLGSKNQIFRAKCEIFNFFDYNNLAIINGDDEFLKTLSKEHFDVVKYGLGEGNDIRAIDIVEEGQNGVHFNVIIDNDKVDFFVPLPGVHNVYNALAAICIGIRYNVEIEKIKKGIIDFRPVKMRMDIFTTGDNIKIINDVYNANPDSMVAAINVLKSIKEKNRSVCILGDMMELGDYSKEAHNQIGKYVSESGVDVLITVGDKATYIGQGAIQTGMDIDNVFGFSNNHEAINSLFKILKPNDIVLIKGSRAMAMEQIVDILRERGK